MGQKKTVLKFGTWFDPKVIISAIRSFSLLEVDIPVMVMIEHFEEEKPSLLLKKGGVFKALCRKLHMKYDSGKRLL
jgi:hypothetical protein